MKSRKEENIKPNNIALAHLEFAILSIALRFFRIYTVKENINTLFSVAIFDKFR